MLQFLKCRRKKLASPSTGNTLKRWTLPRVHTRDLLTHGLVYVHSPRRSIGSYPGQTAPPALTYIQSQHHLVAMARYWCLVVAVSMTLT